ncbi:hypothetical protein PoB_006095000 [Plakobranchus ocellatus]|uniref:Uncharacterized protein n=1 Tax=Plakobranchus ocellatus TaxID=259542 RepID=A0AAV4CRI8_9GAST|nr:hypothetical protein PoB_006095000 [Plakobranchus ocellatus]
MDAVLSQAFLESTVPETQAQLEQERCFQYMQGFDSYLLAHVESAVIGLVCIPPKLEDVVGQDDDEMLVKEHCADDVIAVRQGDDSVLIEGQGDAEVSTDGEWGQGVAVERQKDGVLK